MTDTVFPEKMHRLTLAMIKDGGSTPWNQQLDRASTTPAESWNSATVLHLVDAAVFGIDPSGTAISSQEQERSWSILRKYLLDMAEVDRKRHFWHRWQHPGFWKMSRLRDVVRKALPSPPLFPWRPELIRKAAERHFAHVPEDIVERWEAQGRP